MARLPDETALGNAPSGRSGRAIASVDLSGASRGLEALGAGIQNLSQGFYIADQELKQQQREFAKLEAARRFEEFKFNESRNFLEASETVNPDRAAEFPDAYIGGEEKKDGYYGRAKAFIDTLPEDLRPEYDFRLYEYQTGLHAKAIDRAREVQIVASVQRMEDTFNNIVLPRLNGIGNEPNASDRARTLQDVITSMNDLIDQNPLLSPEQKETARRAARKRAETGFAENLSPADRIEWLMSDDSEPQTSDEAKRLAELGIVTEPPRALSFEERQKGIEVARREREALELDERRREIEERKTMINQLEVDLLDGKAGMSDIDAARSSGWLTEADDIVRLQNRIKERDKATTAIEDVFSYPPRLFNKADKYDRDTVEDAYKELTRQAPDDSMNILDAIVEQTGIVPESAAIAIRGSLLSSDPAMVAVAANLASNILKRDPHAFEGQPNEEQIVDNALLYEIEIERRGQTAEEAAIAVIKANSREEKNRVKVTDPELKKFRDDVLTPIKAEAAIASWFKEGSGISGYFEANPGVGLAPEVKREMINDFVQIAGEAFGRNGDAELSKEIALRRLDRIWGVVEINGERVVMRYPPTDKLPPIKMADGSEGYGYITEQARVFAETHIGSMPGMTGTKVEKILPVPIPGETSVEFGQLKQGESPPYAVMFSYMDDGQEVWDIAIGEPGNRFRFDWKKADAEQKALAEKAIREQQQKAIKDKLGTTSPKFGDEQTQIDRFNRAEQERLLQEQQADDEMMKGVEQFRLRSEDIEKAQQGIAGGDPSRPAPEPKPQRNRAGATMPRNGGGN